MTTTTTARPLGFTGQTSPTRQIKDSGQASIEFLLTFAFGIGFTLLFTALALNMTKGYLVHYANFMASRTFLSYDRAGIGAVEQSLKAAEERAKDVFKSYPLGDFGISVKFGVNRPGNVSPLFAGATSTFSERMTPLSLVGGENRATFLSESFLGKEPPRLECHLSVCQAMGIENCNEPADITVYDNGC